MKLTADCSLPNSAHSEDMPICRTSSEFLAVVQGPRMYQAQGFDLEWIDYNPLPSTGKKRLLIRKFGKIVSLSNLRTGYWIAMKQFSLFCFTLLIDSYISFHSFILVMRLGMSLWLRKWGQPRSHAMTELNWSIDWLSEWVSTVIS